MAIRDPQKPNQLGADKSGYGDAGSDPDNDNDVDTGDGGDTDNDAPATPLVGPPPNSEDHNSAWVPNPSRPID